MTTPAQEAFEARLVAFIRDELPGLSAKQAARRRPPRAVVGGLEPATTLFETGHVDSLGLVFLLATVEELLGIEIPEERILMKNFRSVRAIWAAFGAPREPGVADAP